MVRFGFASPGVSPVGIAPPQGIEGHFWLDPSILINLGASTLPSTGLVTTQVPLPANPNLIGLQLNFQDVILDVATFRGEITEVARMIIAP